MTGRGRIKGLIALCQRRKLVKFMRMEWDVFISHASEDKDSIVRPLASLLIKSGLSVWLDEHELRLGDSLRAKIDEGLSQSRHGVVILSKAFFEKKWPTVELNALVSRETSTRKVILPVWHSVDREYVARFSPILADKLAVRTHYGVEAVAAAICKAIRTSSPRLETDGVVSEGQALTESEAPSRMHRPMSSLAIEDAVRSIAPDLFIKYAALKAQLRHEVYPFWDEGENDCGSGHIERVLEKLDQLVGDGAVRDGHIGIYELYLSMMSVLCHDIAILGSREQHAKEAANTPRTQISATFLNDDRHPHDRNVIRVARVSHSTPHDIESKCKGFTQQMTIGQHLVRPRLVAALVCLADELDQDYRRASELAGTRRSLPEGSLFFWRFRQRISGIRAEPFAHRIVMDVHFAPDDVGHLANVNGVERVFLFAFAEELARINNERLKINKFLPAALNYSHLVVNVSPLEGHVTWDKPRQFLFGDATTANHFIYSCPELLDSRLNVNLLSIYMLLLRGRYNEALRELRVLKSQMDDLPDRAQHFVLYNLACALSRVAASEDCADPATTLDSAVENIADWIGRGQERLWATINLEPTEAFKKLIWDSDLNEVRKKRRNEIQKLLPVDYSSWLGDPPERPREDHCVAARSIVSTPSGDVEVQNVQQGMTILCVDTRSLASSLVPTTVKEIKASRVSMCLRVNEVLVATPTQRVYEETKKWIPLRDVAIGMKLLTKDGSYISVERLEEILGPLDVYELSTGGGNLNFIANGFVCHNFK
jgi:hypothetical protein